MDNLHESTLTTLRSVRFLAVVVAGLALAVSVLFYAEAIRLADINPDAGTYLSAALRVQDGAWLYRDLALGYTPLAIWGAASWAALWGGAPGYDVWLSLVVLVIVFDGVLLGMAARRMGTRRWVAVATGLLWLYVAYLYDGVHWVLEPFVVAFVLLALVASLGSQGRPGRMFLAGMAVGAAFLTKQYGLGAAVPVAFVAVLEAQGTRDRLVAVGAAAVGSIAVLGSMLLFQHLVAGVGPVELLSSWSGQGYAGRGASDGASAAGRFVLRRAPWLLALPILCRSARACREPVLWVLLSGLFIFSVPLVIRSYSHYLLLVAPWALLLGAWSVQKAVQVRSRWVRALVSVLIVAGVVQSIGHTVRVRNRHLETWDRSGQVALAQQVAQAVPPGSRAWVLDNRLQWLNVLLDLRPLEPMGAGYGFPSNFDENGLRHVLEQGTVALLTARLRGGIVENALERAGYRPAEVITPTLRVWRR